MHGSAGIGLLLGALALAAGCSRQGQVRYERAANEPALTEASQAAQHGDHQAGTELGGSSATGSGGIVPPKRQTYVTGDTATEQGATNRPGGPGSDSPPESPWIVRMIPIDLSGQGVHVRLTVPEGTTVSSQFGTVKMTHGPRFSIELTPQAADLNARRREIQNDGIQHLRRFAVDSADTLVYEQEASAGPIGQTEYHFVANVSAGGHTYRCEDTKGASYTQAEVQAMLDACRSIVGK